MELQMNRKVIHFFG